MLRALKRHCFPRWRKLASVKCFSSLPGDKLHGYTVDKVQEVPEIDAVAIQLTHDGTGAQHLHIAKDDPNNTFSVGFSTIPSDSTGVAHILEHTTLCGSKKYPVRDPFFKMLNRSLSNFMNAFTANDWTMYIFSTQNRQDFQNLMSVYLDCVFFPQLRPLDFKQEGWRLEHSDIDDKTSPIIFKGVVFNEMKGYFANSEHVYSEAIQNHLFPSTTYSHVSGGRPSDIVDLSLGKMKSFHWTFYHPSNACFMTYGNFPLESHLERIDELVLCGFDKNLPPEDVSQREMKWSSPRQEYIQCSQADSSVLDPSKQCTFSMSYMLSPITDRYEAFVQNIICYLMCDGPTSFFSKSLLEKNIGSQYSPSTGYNDGAFQSYFSIGLQGIDEDSAGTVEAIINSTFLEAARLGVPDERIASVIHQMELSQKFQEKNTGLKLATGVISPWIHGADPVKFLLANELIDRFKADVSKEFIQQKIEECFIENKHCLKLSMTPHAEYEQSLKSMEDAKCEGLLSSMTAKECDEIHEQGLLLREDQTAMSDLSVLPSVKLADVSKKGYPVEVNEIENVCPTYFVNKSTNGLLYYHMSASFAYLSEELKMYIPLFCHIITRMGAGDLDYSQFSQRCDLCTGQFSMMPVITPDHTSCNSYFEDLLCSSYCMHYNIDSMLALWKDVFLRPQLHNQDRFSTLLKQLSTDLSQSVSMNGHLYSMHMSSSSLLPSSQSQENMYGITQVKFLRDLTREGDMAKVLAILDSIAKEVFNLKHFRFLWTSTPESTAVMEKSLLHFTNELPQSTSEPCYLSKDDLFLATSGKKLLLRMPYSVNYVSQSFGTVPYSHQDSPKLKLLAKLLSSKYLHKNIREIGGAYGSSALQRDGIFSFMSYRDPNVLSTLEVFEGSKEWLLSNALSEQDLEEAKFSLFSEIDSPVSVKNNGMDLFLRRQNDSMKQKYRDSVFLVQRDDLVDVCERYFTESRNSTVIGPCSSAMDSSWVFYDY